MAATFDPLYAEPTDEGLARLRAREPISATPSGPWFIASYDAVLEATQDIDTYRASFRDPGVVVPDDELMLAEVLEPRHGEIRRIINSAIAPHRIAPIADFCEDLCVRLLAELRAGSGPVDLFTDFILPVPNHVIAELLGAEPSHYEKWARWSEELQESTYVTLNRTERGEGLAGAHPEYTAFVDSLVADRRANPREDFVTRLITRDVEGEPLSDVEARSQLVFLFTAGNATTRHLLGNLFFKMATDPALFGALRADRELVPVAVEEALRMFPPVRVLLRDVMQDKETHGKSVCPHEKIAFGLECANRDEAVYEDPHEFRLDRDKPRNHLAFGGGPHVCPGASLARMEARIAVNALLDVVESMTIHGSDEYVNGPLWWARGPESLTVDIVWSPSAAGEEQAR